MKINVPVIRNCKTTNVIVVRNETGSDVVWCGVDNGEHKWTWQPDKMREMDDAAMAIDMIKLNRMSELHDHGDGARVVVAYKGYGPYLKYDKRTGNMIAIGVNGDS